ncbi:universal stress protein [Lentilactobacillus senioris]|uniref:Universal stress protein n=1 Tax=Lentilactobacillus senioris DSM 24302 = JCM 17472 TaxID=1423802 RepID=A0A0R2CQD5_9LACO|nr:universal stress protein [Lentilactobacillus senioris]KRM93997.1 universal stress family protein [Lentilactobacillus senioris DSM 24302 = JCM 17472]
MMTESTLKNYNRILVGVDESQTASLAVDRAIMMAKTDEAKLIIASVINDREIMGVSKKAILGFGAATPDQVNQVKDEVTTMVQRYVQRASDAGVDAESVITLGDPRGEIATNLANKYDVDLIVVGATGVNLVGRMMLGSTADYVIRNAKCDVFVVHDYLETK